MSLSRVLGGVSAALALSVLGACQTTGGFPTAPLVGESEVEAEFARVRSAGRFEVREIDSGEAHVIARGREVALSPISGLCLTAEGIEATESGVFAVIADCVTETGVAPAGTDAAGDTVYRLPPAFPGLLTVSVSGDPLFEPGVGQAEGVRQLREFLASSEGLALLGRNGSGETVAMLESRPMGDGVYVHVRDTHSGDLALLAPGFWRAFVEINGRLVLITVSGFRDRPLSDEMMLAVLAAQVTRLREVNDLPLYGEEERLAATAEGYLESRGAQVAVTGPLPVARADRPVPEVRTPGGTRVVAVERTGAVEPGPDQRVVRVEIPEGPGAVQAPDSSPGAPDRPGSG